MLVNVIAAFGRQLIDGKVKLGLANGFIFTWIILSALKQPLFVTTFDVKEFVFIGFIGAGSWSLYRTQKKNENTIEENNNYE